MSRTRYGRSARIEEDDKVIEPQDDVREILMDKLPEDMTDAEKDKVDELLRDYDNIFSKSTYDMGRTHLVEHSIDTGDHSRYDNRSADI